MIFKWLGKFWRKCQRGLDIQILWPECVKNAPDLDHARIVFMFHCMHDPAWTKDYTEEDLVTFIGQLNRSSV